MNAITKKERRLLQPISIATFVATLASALIFNGSEASTIVTMVFGTGVTLMAASAFGNEFHARTMLLLLTQPVSRRQLWLMKMRELGLELAAIFAVLLISLMFLVRGEGRLQVFSMNVLLLALIPLVTFCSTPFASLSSRNTLAAMAVTVGIPWGLVMLLLGADWLVSHALLGWDRFLLEKVNENRPHLFISISVVAGLGYCAVLYWLGYQTFLNYEVIDSQPQDITLPASVETRLAGWAEELLPGYTSPFASLVRKELRLHRVSFIFVGFLVLVAPFLAVARAVHRSELTESLSFLPLIVCIILIPFLTGLATVSEERNLGVLNWQLTFPISLACQWKVKMLVGFSVCIVLGLIIPGMVLYIGHALLKVPMIGLDNPLFFGFSIVLYCFLFYLVVFASSITNNVTRGMVAALGLWTACSIAIGLGNHLFELLVPSMVSYDSIANVQQWSTHGDGLLVFTFMLITTFVNILVINWFSFTNFKSEGNSVRRLCFQVATIPLLSGFFTIAVRVAAALTETHF